MCALDERWRMSAGFGYGPSSYIGDVYCSWRHVANASGIGVGLKTPVTLAVEKPDVAGVWEMLTLFCPTSQVGGLSFLPNLKTFNRDID